MVSTVMIMSPLIQLVKGEVVSRGPDGQATGGTN